MRITRLKHESLMYLGRHDYFSPLFRQTKNGETFQRNKSSKIPIEVKEYIDDIVKPLRSKRNVKKVEERFVSCLNDSLAGKKCSMNLLCTFVQDFPTGNETGRYLALDLGGTNFRSMLMDIKEGEVKFTFKKEMVPEDVRSSGGNELFDFMGNFTHAYLSETLKGEVSRIEFPTVLTFSFPVKQTGINKGTIISFSKGYNCKDVIGKDLGKLLTESFANKGVNIKLLGIINDTVGTLLASRWFEFTSGGIVIGTGTNAAYTEKIELIENFKGDPKKPMIVMNTEWGAFGDQGELDFIRTPIDHTLDKNSSNPGQQTLEKMVSGMYMNEIVRQALVQIGEKNLFCSSELYEAFKEPFSFAPKIISTLEEDAESGHCILCKPVKKYYRQKSTMEMLKNELLGKSTESKIKIQDFHIIREVCQAITERGARLVGIAIGCLAKRIDRKKVVFGIDGTHYNKTLTYKKLIPLQIKAIVPDKEVKLVSVEDGSLKGAAFLAATLNEQQ